MVQLSWMLMRTPVIKFRKGVRGSPSGGTPTAAAASSTPQQSSSLSCAFARQQQAAPMSTCSIPDIELPLKYQRSPLTQDEIDKINGGGIV